MPHDLGPIVKDWPAEPGGIRVRLIRSRDDREYIQLRVDLGVLQLEIEGRPDGEKPFDLDSMLSFLEQRSSETPGDLDLDEDELEEISRELMQYYRRRISLMALAEQARIEEEPLEADRFFRLAAQDATHNLHILDIIDARIDDDEFVEEHIQYRPFIIMHRSMCQAERALLAGLAELAVETVKYGIREIRACCEDEREEIDTGEDVVDVASLIEALRMMERRIRKEHEIEQTLSERLDDAIEREDYEQAARLRDELDKRSCPPGLSFPPDTLS